MMSGDGLTQEMISRLRGGDTHAFVELFSLHRGRLKRMVDVRLDPRLRTRADASDIVQEVYLDAHRRMRHYLKRPELSFYIWLRRLALQRLIDVHRRHLGAEMRDAKQEVSIDRATLHGTSSASLASQLVGRLTSPSQVAIRAELLMQLEEALDEMDPIDREILTLRHFEELRNSEVAEVLGIKEAAASNRYVRALSRLRSVLAKLPGFFDQL